MGPSHAAAPTVSEPNLKLRYKPKKCLERRKNPLLRKESAPPSLRRRPAETLGGEASSRHRQAGATRSHQDGSPLGVAVVLVQGVPYTLARGELGLKASLCSVS